VTLDDVRSFALSLPEPIEAPHHERTSFRVRGKIFATLAYPDDTVGMVKLTPQQQAEYVQADPKAFVPVKGTWGLRGATHVRLKSVKKAALQRALLTAWRNTAPKNLAGPYEPESR